MRPQTIKLTTLAFGVATSGIPISYRGKNATFNVGVQADWTTSSDGEIQVTMDDPDNYANLTTWNSTAIWSPLADNPIEATTVTSLAGTVTANCFGIRFKNTSGATGMTDVTLRVLQD